MNWNMGKREAFLRAWIWLGRCRYSRGFGVQSPWAYRLIRYVINEHYPYYAYKTLKKEYSAESAILKKLSFLYFRIANYCQCQRWYFAIDQYDMKAAYVKAGCQGTEIVNVLNGYKLDWTSEPDVLVMTLESNWFKIFNSFADHATARSILIVENIHYSKNILKLWKEIQEDERCGITFDLYYCGLVFFDKTMFKQHYIVNF